MQVGGPGVLDPVPDPAPHKHRAAAPQRHAASVEDGGPAPRVHEDDFILMLMQVHRDRRARPETLTARGEQGRPGAPAIDLDRHISAAGRRPQAQRLAVPRSEHQPLWLHHVSSRFFDPTHERRRAAWPRRRNTSSS
jgi:hypothetical protein